MDIGEEKIDNQESDASYYREEPGDAYSSEGPPSLSIRHLILIFLGGIVVCAIFFALGFLIGKNQGRMEQVLSSNSRSSIIQNSAEGNPTPKSASSSGQETGAAASGKLEFFDEVNRNYRSDAPAQSLAAKKSDPTRPVDTAKPVRPVPDDSLAKSAAPIENSPTASVPKAENPASIPSTPSASSNAGASQAPAVSLPQTAKAKEGSEVFRIQIGAFKTQDEAQNLVLELEGKSFEAFIEPPSGNVNPLYRVQMGPYSSKAKVTEMTGRLKKAGFSTLLKKY